MVLQFRKAYEETKEDSIEYYSGFLKDIAALLLLFNSQPLEDFENEIKEVLMFSCTLDQFPEEAFADISFLYAEVQSYLSRTSSVLSNMYVYKSKLGRLVREGNRIFKKAKNRILATEEDIRKLRNQSLQEAAINDKLYYIVDIIDSINNSLEYLSEQIDIVAIKEKDLDRINSNINRQQRHVESLIGLNYPVHTSHKRK